MPTQQFHFTCMRARLAAHGAAIANTLLPVVAVAAAMWAAACGDVDRPTSVGDAGEGLTSDLPPYGVFVREDSAGDRVVQFAIIPRMQNYEGPAILRIVGPNGELRREVRGKDLAELRDKLDPEWVARARRLLAAPPEERARMLATPADKGSR